MKNSDHKFWPYNPKLSILWSFAIVIVLLLLLGILKFLFGWPSDSSTNMVILGIFIMSLLPILLPLLDILIDRGGSIGYKDFKIDFLRIEQLGTVGFELPANIGVRGEPVSDSMTTNILDALKKAGSNSIVIIDLEDGQAWWETRLLVLLSGAKRLGCPNKIVFVANRTGVQQTFIGWATPENLLTILLRAHEKYKIAYHIAKAISKQWNLVAPLYKTTANLQIPPVKFGWMTSNPMYDDWAYDNATGMLNELFEEQVLQNELGLQIEKQEGGKNISIGRIIDLFDEVLYKNHIDQNSTPKQQTVSFFDNDDAWMAITEKGKYVSLVSRNSILNEVIRPQIEKNSSKS